MVRKSFCLIVNVILLLAWAVPCPAEPPHYSRVDAGLIEDRLRCYEGEDADRRITLMRLFEDVGCRNGFLRAQPVEDADAPNVICTLPGRSEKVIIVGAHFDRVDEGDGVADNWSGASLLPSLYQSLRSKVREHTFIFIGFSDEEEGFIGSGFYAEQLTAAQLESIQAMINLDTLGLDSTKVWARNSDPDLVSLIRKVASYMHLPIDPVNVDDIGDSDGISFKKRDVPILTLHTVTPDTLHILHSEQDRFSAVDLNDYYDSYNLIAAFLAALDSGDGPR